MKTSQRSPVCSGPARSMLAKSRMGVPPRHRSRIPCYAPTRTDAGMRVVWDDVEEFATATAKVSVPVVEWRDDFGEKYSLEEEVAAGSFGTIWRGSDKRTGEPVAVKRLQMQRGSLTKERIKEKVEQEVAVMMDLQGHVGTVQLHGAFIEDDHYSVVMDFCGGSDLKVLVQESGPISEGLCAAVAWQILGVLRKCREAKVVHGDVKAANFVVASETCNPFRSSEVTILPPGWLKAVDFGASLYFRGRPKDVIRGRCGTPVYMAPEVLWGYYGFQADMWSLGMTLFYLMTGRFPLWESEEEALRQNLMQVKDAVFRQPMRVGAEDLGNPSASCLDFIRRLLIRNSASRMTLEDALHHPFFKQNLSFCEDGAVMLELNNIVDSGKLSPSSKLSRSSKVLDSTQKT
ncbi:hypothetical protein BSKO_01863 [Bryopsis sp. KO-2023]|nr:hypothetical protein BSKO_01863 [Bryopsis sp. KO-2023]